ncbi:DUF6896 domain-containing protein [Chryseobacterium viscerum]|uniref:DUF6896 domain-containing protein n=1 Tax=Chryseobacterium viscerum TaxID=1037377 RepID=UPI0022214A74|nr:hypothetical protein [Chryseobacterium viscerum]MCW1961010.1 hypothetical protein [Chryseobacterium viscerum]
MERATHVITAKSIQELPGIDSLRNIPRQKTIRIIFDHPIRHIREDYGEQLKKNLPHFIIGIHSMEPKIEIRKLITKEEIIANQLFFVQCAKDYRKLGEELVSLFFEKKKIKLNKDFPFLAFNYFKGRSRRTQSGKVGKWRYFLHGYHCYFQNVTTKQEIEVPFMFGMEFGDLDPYFFSLYIKSTPKYRPLPITIYEDFADGERILDVMLQLGLLERINSNLENHSGLVIKDRNKVEIKIYNPDKDYEKPKFQFGLSRLIQFFNL